jgi:hypothetical protein
MDAPENERSCFVRFFAAFNVLVLGNKSRRWRDGG